MFPDLLRPLLFPAVLVCGLLAPGWLLGRALRSPVGATGALLGSAALLFNLILILDACDVRLDARNLGAGLAVWCATLGGIARWRRRAATPPVTTTASAGFRWAEHGVLLVPAALGLGAVVVRATLDPLSGFDTYFRWDFPARQMVHEGNLHFYPAVSADDFLRYGWCDGIAPLVSSLYFWSYASLGRIAAWATAPIVVGQAVLLFGVVWQLAARRGGPVAGAAACAILATSGLSLWGVAMGQETGLTALGLAAMFRFIDLHADEPDRRWLAWAGVAAGIGALAREYGLVFVALGAFTLAWRKIPRRGRVEFAVAAAAVALPWYLRNGIMTGNPLWPHPVGGLFPTNPAQADYFHSVAGLTGIGSTLGSGSSLVTIAILVGVVGALGLWVGLARRREDAPWLVAIAVVVGLWLWSIGQTSGGYVYSLRVLTPALALGAALGGIVLARWAGTRRRVIGIGVLLILPAADTSARSLYLPIDARVAWWRGPPSAWQEFGEGTAGRLASPNWAAITDAADGRQIVVSDPSCHARLAELKARPVPLFSPAVRFLFDPAMTLAGGTARLREGGARFVLLTRHNAVLGRQLARHPFFRALLASPPAATTTLFFVYDLFPRDLGGNMAPSPRPHAP